jgi:hypothetical protein
MKAELINLFISLILTILYLIGAIKVLRPFFLKISNPMTAATGTLYFGVILGFGLILNDFSEIASSAFYYNFQKSQVGMAIFYWLLFAGISFLFCFLVFHLSYRMIDLATIENEKVELAKNNYAIAGLHIVTYLTICLVGSKSLIAWANGFVNFPTYPN